MAEKLRLFVSATSDLENSRAVIGRAVADLPVQIGVEIRRTPAQGAAYDDIFELIANVDRVYFLLGRDITAPAGAEWHLAWQLERSILPLRAVVPRTPAAQEFARNFLGEWTRLRSNAELARLVTLDLVRILDHPTNRYGLTVPDFELLKLHAARVMKQAPDVQGEAGGAEGGGVLLDTVHGEEFNDQFDDELLVSN
ncbi:MAG: hypothetical protein IT328_20995 [Caldilineaceae bacterium]|nr:hypothetical protein [Caldilineaceae bacterium]